MIHSRSRSAAGPDPADEGMEALVARYRGPLRSFFHKRAFDRQEAEDLTQEVFCRLAARNEGQPVDNPGAYVFQVAANLLRDRARRDMTRAAAMRDLGEQSGNDFEEFSPERVLQGRDRLAAIQRALMELPERTRAIFLLHRFEEYKYVEIARRLGISVSAVEKHMMDAIRHLATRVERE